MKRRSTIIALVILLAVGFAAVSTTLVLNGVIGLGESDDFKIIFTSASIDGTKRNDVIGSDKTTINYETKTLTTVEEESELVYEATNTSRNYDAEVSIECNIVDNEGNKIEGNNIYVDMTYEPNQMLLSSGETKSGKVHTRLIKAVTEPMDINIKCILNATPVERDTLGDGYVDPNKLGGTLMVQSENTAFWQHKSNITKIVFENTLTEHETTNDLIYDVSVAQDKSVMSYLVPNEEDTTKYTLYINSDGKVVANENSSNLFYRFTNLQEIEKLEYLDTSKVTNMSRMFSNCSSLTTLDLSNFDTSNVTNMSSMFFYYNGTNLDLSNFDTSNVTDMSSMFSDCSSLITLDISNFNTSKVTNMFSIFYSCSSLTTLDLSNFDTIKVTDMSYMFFNCPNLTSLDLSNFDTSNVTDMRGMFLFCRSLTALNLSNFDTSNVTSMNTMFNGCTSLTKIDLSNVDASIITNEKIFSEMPDTITIIVKDKAAQDALLAHPDKKSTWTTSNIIIKG